jgi:4-amino-4-deoxy-L-arabinose transferase-like glycosyltransferase
VTDTILVPPPVAASTPETPSLLRKLARGRTTDAPWVRPSLLILLAATAVLYIVGLGASGWANSFYSAAAQAGSVSWKAFFYGSSDAANSITVDKPPASLWIMALSVRIFGLHSWSILLPQALEGLAAVGVLYATVRRWFSPGAGLLAGAVLALTPVATLMFRFNNPDALLVLLLVLSAYALVRAVENGRTRWLVLCATLIGCGFLTKMLQAFLVVPAFALVYLLAGPTPIRRRLRQLLLAGIAMLVSAGWWVAIVELVPAKNRPYIGGSQHNSVLDLIFGYNGFGRITGNETGSVGGNRGGGGWGATGWSRLFGSEMGGQISWLLPAALGLLAVLLWLTRRAPRTDRTRAAMILWSGWLLVTGVVFSYMQGIVHPYYTVALAPAIGAIVGIGTTTLWRMRRRQYASAILAVVLAGTAIWSYVLLDRSAEWESWLRYFVLIGGLGGAVVLLTAPYLTRRLATVVGAAALTVAMAGPAAYSAETAATVHTGAIPSAGPTATTGFGGGGGPGMGRGGFGQNRGIGGRPGGSPQQQGGGATGGSATGGSATGGSATGGSATGGSATGGSATGGSAAGGGGMGGLLGSTTPSAALVSKLTANAGSYTWIAATVGSNNASGYQLATGEAVMPIGGFNGTDPSPTLTQFENYVKEGKIHYFISAGSLGAANSGSSTSQQIASWVQSHYTSTTVGGVTLYDLTAAK